MENDRGQNIYHVIENYSSKISFHKTQVSSGSNLRVAHLDHFHLMYSLVIENIADSFFFL